MDKGRDLSAAHHPKVIASTDEYDSVGELVGNGFLSAPPRGPERALPIRPAEIPVHSGGS